MSKNASGDQGEQKKPRSADAVGGHLTAGGFGNLADAMPKPYALPTEQARPRGVSRAKGLTRKFLDTETLFAAGDFAAAYLTAEIFGILTNGGAAVVALAGKVYELRTGSKPLGLGFYAMALVSLVTTLSIAVNFSRNYPIESLVLGDAPAVQSAFTGAAFAAWTLANLFAALEKSQKIVFSGRGGIFLGAQFWFCIGSVLVTQSGTVSGVIFLSALVKGIFGRSSSPFRQVSGIGSLLGKHLTTPRLRAVAYLTCTVEAALSGSDFVYAYALWMFGNAVFESPRMNRSLVIDVRRLIKKGLGYKRI